MQDHERNKNLKFNKCQKKLSFNVGLHLYPCPYFHLHPYHILTILYLPVVRHEAVPEALNVDCIIQKNMCQ